MTCPKFWCILPRLKTRWELARIIFVILKHATIDMKKIFLIQTTEKKYAFWCHAVTSGTNLRILPLTDNQIKTEVFTNDNQIKTCCNVWQVLRRRTQWNKSASYNREQWPCLLQRWEYSCDDYLVNQITCHSV